jgi:hypothetical protein
MKKRVGSVLLLLCLVVPSTYSQTTEETVDSTDSSTATETVTTSTSTTSVTTETASIPAPAGAAASSAPGWMHVVRLAAIAGPFAFLVLAWLIGAVTHVRLVRREQEQFPMVRGSRAPQWVPMTISGLLFFIPAILFVIFEIRSRVELRRGIGGVVDEWQPVTQRAWVMLVICLVLALVPWLFARRADTVS